MQHWQDNREHQGTQQQEYYYQVSSNLNCIVFSLWYIKYFVLFISISIFACSFLYIILTWAQNQLQEGRLLTLFEHVRPSQYDHITSKHFFSLTCSFHFSYLSFCDHITQSFCFSFSLLARLYSFLRQLYSYGSKLPQWRGAISLQMRPLVDTDPFNREHEGVQRRDLHFPTPKHASHAPLLDIPIRPDKGAAHDLFHIQPASCISIYNSHYYLAV